MAAASLAHYPKSKDRIYTLRVYDVWGNYQDGFTVNDAYESGEIRIRCRAHVYNAGTPNEVVEYTPTERQLSRAVGERGLVWSGESDYTLYAETLRGKPVCELVFERFADGPEGETNP
jgi:hypothetical protein